MILRLFFFLSLIFFSFSARADEIHQDNPQVVLESVSSRLTFDLMHRRKEQSVIASVEKWVLPMMDLDTMSKTVVGRHEWQKATNDQKSEIQNLFVQLMLKTYASAFMAYEGQVIRFQTPHYISSTDAQVRCVIQNQDQDIHMVYQLKRVNQQWKIYDFSVEGISIVASLQSQFNSVIAQRGVMGLIENLKQVTQKQ